MANMCRAWEETKRESLEKGVEQGIKQGIKQGREQGVEQVAVNMIRENMDDTLIQRLTGLSAERIAELREQAARKGGPYLCVT